MRRLIAASLLVLALGAGSASADTFAVVPDQFVALPETPQALPSAEVPNATGSILLPPGAWEAAFLPVRELSYEELRMLWVHAGASYGIPWQVLAAINKIESNFGRNMGPSSSGAVGWMQFMPDTWLRWGTDGNGDGIADPWNPDDAIHSAARYLAAANGRTDIARAIFAYNHAQWYVDDVLQLAAMFGGDFESADAVFTLDRMALALEQAQEQVASLSEQLDAAEAAESESAAKSERLTAAAEDLGQLLSDRVLAEKDAFQAGEELAAATAEADRLRSELAQAEAALETAQSSAASASFAPAAAGVLRMPTRADGYVFPVGGGPGVVSVGRHHHDYPAADIAAPLGAPLYALADGIVLSVVDDGRCGTGFVLRTLDGLEWVVLPSLVPRSGPRGGPGRERRPVGRPRRLDRPLDRARTSISGSGRRAIRRRCRGSRSSPGSPSCGRTSPARPRFDRRRSSRSCRRRSRPGTSSNSHSRGVEFVPASADRRGMTAGVIGRLPRVGVIVCAIGLVTGTLAFAASSTLSTPAAPAAAPGRRQARAARRPRRPQAGLRLREGLARAGRLRLAGRGLRARLRRERRRLAVARAGHAGDRRRRSDHRPPPQPQRLLRAGGRPRERLPVRRQAAPGWSDRRSRSERPPRRRPPLPRRSRRRRRRRPRRRRRRR